MSDARQMLRSGVVICVIALIAWGSHWMASVIGYLALSEWGKIAWGVFVFQTTPFIPLILRTYDIQNIEALSQQQRQKVREIVSDRVKAIWALFSLNFLGIISALVAHVARDEPAAAASAATALVFFHAMSMLTLMVLPGFYHQIEHFRSLIIQNDREKKARTEILKEMSKAADAGYKPDTTLDSYNHLIEPNSHA